MTKPTKEEAMCFAQKQLDGELESQKSIYYHYGKMEILQLLDYIYGESPRVGNLYRSTLDDE